MADENQKVEGSEDNGTPEVPAIEVKAREMGWRPKEEFHGDEDDFIDAKEFVRRQPLFEKIEGQSRQLKNVQKTLEALKGHYTQVREAEYKRALATLEAQKETAISDADGARAVAVEKQIKNVEKQYEQIQRENAQDTSTSNNPEEFVSWKAKNAWYESDETMRVFADAYGTKLANQGMSPSEVLDAVTKKVKTEFNHKFRNPNKDSAPDVDVSSARGASRASERYELTELERSIMNTLVRDGTMTEKQYIADLKAIKASR